MKKKLLIIGFVWPEPKSSAAGSRMLQLIDQFQAQHYDITFASAANISDRSFDLSWLGINVKGIELNHSSFDAFIKDLNPELVLFDRFMTVEQYGWRVAKNCPDALRILDMEDFHGLRKARELAMKENRAVDISDLQNTVSKREIASMYCCDLNLVISESEMEILTHYFGFPKEQLYYLPFLIDSTPKSKTEENTFESRENFISIGNFLHAPNHDATLYLKSEIWPKIREKIPGAELHVYGAYSSQKVLDLNDYNKGFIIKGFTKDVNRTMSEYRVCLAPLRFGAGLKGKLIDAMVNGTPCVMSSIAAEGMFGEFEPNGFVEDTSGIFAEKAVQLYNTEELWRQKQEFGAKILKQRFDKSQFTTPFSEFIAHFKEHLNTHRQHNFIGQILQLQGFQSTKYLSKWIELKNS
jgi:glycosyltransferase involved in cell wall biosynthesis